MCTVCDGIICFGVNLQPDGVFSICADGHAGQLFHAARIVVKIATLNFQVSKSASTFFPHEVLSFGRQSSMNVQSAVVRLRGVGEANGSIFSNQS